MRFVGPLRKWAQQRDDDRLARRAIERTLAQIVKERQAELERLNSARAWRELDKAEQSLRAWRKRRKLDHIAAMRVLTMARIEDSVGAAPDQRRQLRAVHSYLMKHHPPTVK